MTEQASPRIDLTLSRLTSSERELRVQVAADVTAIAGMLGLAVRPAVNVRIADVAPRRIAIHVDGARLRYDRLVESQLEQVGEALGDGDADLAAGLVRAALTANPALLVSEQQIIQWCERASIAATGTVASALRAAVGQGRSVRDVEALLDEAAQLDPCHPGEALNGLLGVQPLVVQLAPEYLRALPEAPADGVTEASIRESLADGLGVPLPPLRIEPDLALRGTEVRIQINDLPVALFLGLPPGRYAGISPPEGAFAGKMASRSIIFPFGQRGEALDAADRDAFAASGLPTWNALEFILLGVTEAVTRFAPRLLTRAHVVRQLDLMRDFAPALVEDAMSTGCAGELTMLCAQLLAELGPVRDLETIVQAYAYWRLSPSDVSGDLMPAVRRALGIRLATAEPPRGAVAVYLLQPEVEAAAITIASGSPLDEPDQFTDDLIAAIEAEAARLPAGHLTPSLLTTATCRPIIRAWVAGEMHRMRVLAYDEIPGDVLIKPLGRISAVPSG